MTRNGLKLANLKSCLLFKFPLFRIKLSQIIYKLQQMKYETRLGGKPLHMYNTVRLWTISSKGNWMILHVSPLIAGWRPQTRRRFCCIIFFLLSFLFCSITFKILQTLAQDIYFLSFLQWYLSYLKKCSTLQLCCTANILTSKIQLSMV